MRTLIKDKKGQIGLDTVEKVGLAFLIIAVLAFAMIIALSTILPSVENISRTNGIPVINDTLTTVTESGEALTTVETYKCTASLISVVNATGGETIDASNYTLTGCNLAFSGVGHTGYNNTDWNVSFTYTFVKPQANEINTNVTSALSGFFANTGTIFNVLVAVVIILAIAIIVGVVRSRAFSGKSGL